MKLIRNPHLSENLISLFNAEDYISQPFLLGELVIPTVDVTQFTTKLIMDKQTGDSITGAGFKTIGVVPAGKIWEIQCMDIIATSGDGTFTYLYLQKNQQGAALMYLLSQTASAEYMSGVMGSPLIMGAGDAIGVYQDASTTATVYEWFVWAVEKDAPNPAGS